MKILSIDDNGEINSWFKTVFESENYEFTSITSGKDGIRLIRDITYDLVLLDITTPGFSGKDVIDALDKENLLEKQPIILFTASSVTDTEMDNMIIRGVHQCLRKPIKPDIVSSVLRGLTKK